MGYEAELMKRTKRIRRLTREIESLDGWMEQESVMPIGVSRPWVFEENVILGSRTFTKTCPDWAGHPASEDPHRIGFVHHASIKLDPKGPDWVALRKFLNGAADAALTYPRERFIISIWHEPEDEIENGVFTAEEFRDLQMEAHDWIAGYALDNLELAITLMEWTWRKPSRNPIDYLPRYPDGRPAFDLVALDPYDPHAERELWGDLLEPVVLWLRQTFGDDVRWAVAETGTHTPTHESPSNGSQKVWGGAVRSEEDGVRWVTDAALELASEGCEYLLWFHSDVGSSAPWWMPDLVRAELEAMEWQVMG